MRPSLLQARLRGGRGHRGAGGADQEIPAGLCHGVTSVPGIATRRRRDRAACCARPSGSPASTALTAVDDRRAQLVGHGAVEQETVEPVHEVARVGREPLQLGEVERGSVGRVVAVGPDAAPDGHLVDEVRALQGRLRVHDPELGPEQARRGGRRGVELRVVAEDRRRLRRPSGPCRARSGSRLPSLCVVRSADMAWNARRMLLT